MISEIQITLISLCIQIAVFSVLLALTVNLIRENRRRVTAVFLAFCYALWMFSDLYWVIYDIMRPDVRMPFAANEIGEAGTFLMMAATINSVSTRIRKLNFFTAGALIFSCCNTALWIGWSGEWFQDIFFGAIFAWFLCSVTDSLYGENSFAVHEWIIMGLLCTALLVCQALTFVTGDSLSSAFELAAYIIITVTTALLIYKFIYAYAHRKEGDEATLLALAFALVAWIITGKYMSDSFWYILSLILETLCLPLWYLTVKKVVEKE